MKEYGQVLAGSQWEERAAIREVDGGQPAADAERDAFEDVRLEIERAIVAGTRKGPHGAAPGLDDHAGGRRPLRRY